MTRHPSPVTRQLFQANDLDKANSKYEEALAVFTYLLVKPGFEGREG